ncbi:MAG: S9 family peptidase [Acidobacteriota bacterium]
MRSALLPGVLMFSWVIAAGAADTHPYSVHDMVALDRISEPRVSPSGQLVAFTVRVTDLDANKGRTDIYLAPVDGAWLRRVTTHEANDSQPQWAPDRQFIYFLSTRSGSSQVWRIPSGGGESEQVTKLPLDVDALEVAPNGKFLLFSMAVFPGKSAEETKALLEEKENSKATGMIFDRLFVRHWDTWMDGTRNHLFTCDIASRKVTDLMPQMDADSPSRPFGGSEEYTISPDGKQIVFTARDVGREEAWSTNFDLFSVPADASAAPAKLTTNPATDTQPRFSADGQFLAYLAMSRTGYEADRYRIIVREWASGKERAIDLRADDTARGDRSPGDLDWSPDGKAIICTAEHLGQNSLFMVEVATGRSRIVVADGTIGSPQFTAGGRMLYAMDSLLGPVELYTVGPDGKDITRVTRINDARLAEARLGKPEQFTFSGAKGEKVYGYIVYPADFDVSKKYPVAFLIHGGPQNSMGNHFHYRWNPQAYAGAGYAAVMIDFHGSTGYGQAFTDSIRDDWGGAPFADLMKGLDYAVAKYPFLDGTRVGALGASFGGYMINWVAGNAPNRFKALVCHDGNLDERMAYYDTEELWFPEWDHGGLPWTNPLGYSKHNPVELVKNWKTPTLVIHGQNDYRVVYTQGLSTFTALQRKGVPSKFLFFPDENHWVLKPHNSILWHNTVLGWLDKYVK